MCYFFVYTFILWERFAHACIPSVGWSSSCGWLGRGWSQAGSEPDGRSTKGPRSVTNARSPQKQSSTWGYLEKERRPRRWRMKCTHSKFLNMCGGVCIRVPTQGERLVCGAEHNGHSVCGAEPWAWPVDTNIKITALNCCLAFLARAMHLLNVPLLHLSQVTLLQHVPSMYIFVRQNMLAGDVRATKKLINICERAIGGGCSKGRRKEGWLGGGASPGREGKCEQHEAHLDGENCRGK